MTKIRFIAIGASLLPFAAFAHGDMAEGTGISDQFQELLPMMHVSEGHFFSATLVVVLWVFAIYGVYSLIKKCMKPKGPTTGPTV